MSIERATGTVSAELLLCSYHFRPGRSHWTLYRAGHKVAQSRNLDSRKHLGAAVAAALALSEELDSGGLPALHVALRV